MTELELLGPRARSALGLDRNPEMLRIARNRLEAVGLASARVQAGDMYEMPLSPASADTLVTTTSMTAVSVSTFSAHLTLRTPLSIQSRTGTV